MKDLHELHYFLGIEVISTPVAILISQRHFVLNLVYKFGMTECKPVVCFYFDFYYEPLYATS